MVVGSDLTPPLSKGSSPEDTFKGTSPKVSTVVIYSPNRVQRVISYSTPIPLWGHKREDNTSLGLVETGGDDTLVLLDALLDLSRVNERDSRKSEGEYVVRLEVGDTGLVAARMGIEGVVAAQDLAFGKLDQTLHHLFNYHCMIFGDATITSAVLTPDTSILNPRKEQLFQRMTRDIIPVIERTFLGEKFWISADMVQNELAIPEPRSCAGPVWHQRWHNEHHTLVGGTIAQPENESRYTSPSLITITKEDNRIYFTLTLSRTIPFLYYVLSNQGEVERAIASHIGPYYHSLDSTSNFMRLDSFEIGSERREGGRYGPVYDEQHPQAAEFLLKLCELGIIDGTGESGGFQRSLRGHMKDPHWIKTWHGDFAYKPMGSTYNRGPLNHLPPMIPTTLVLKGYAESIYPLSRTISLDLHVTK